MAEPHAPKHRLWFAGLVLGAFLVAVALPMGLAWKNLRTPAIPEPIAPVTEPLPTLDKPAKVHGPWDLPLPERQAAIWPVVQNLSEREGMDPALIMAVVHVESRFEPKAVSERGARGLMQIDRRTARHLGLRNPLDPMANLRAGIRYLSGLRKLFSGDDSLALAAYNAGPTRVRAAGPAMPDIEETRAFVHQVLNQAQNFRTQFQRPVPGLP
jgi:soluble lytic murein transglycosylase-like protein